MSRTKLMFYKRRQIQLCKYEVVLLNMVDDNILKVDKMYQRA